MKALCLRGFILKPTERRYFLLKNGTSDFQYSPLFERSAYSYVTISGNFERFHYFNFKTAFLENKNFFKKLEYRFSVESAKIKNATFSYKPALSEANIKTNGMGSTKYVSQRMEFYQ